MDHSLLFRWTLAGVLCSGAAWAQATQPQGAPGASVEGVVLNDLTKAPIRRAEVRLFKAGNDLASLMNTTPLARVAPEFGVSFPPNAWLHATCRVQALVTLSATRPAGIPVTPGPVSPM